MTHPFDSVRRWAPALLLCVLPACSASAGPKPGASADSGTTAASEGGLPACPSDSGFAGDDLCLPPPPADQGFQLHYGPPRYDDAGMAAYVLAAGEETDDCYFEKTGNTEERYVAGEQIFMRPGSHHLVANVNSDSEADGFHTCEANDQTPGLLGGSQTPKSDSRVDVAPENAGLAIHVPAHAQAVINFHVLNATAKPLLREAWLNYYYVDPSKVTGLLGNVYLIGGLSFRIEPGTHQTYQYSCSPDRPVRIVSLVAHMHAHATRMSMWHVSTAGVPTLVYENYDWEHPQVARYDTVHTNALPDRATQQPGGTSGPLVISPGETLQWECDIDNTSSGMLTFRNEVNTGEMCIAAGAEVPVDDPMSAYDFRCTLN